MKIPVQLLRDGLDVVLKGIAGYKNAPNYLKCVHLTIDKTNLILRTSDTLIQVVVTKPFISEEALTALLPADIFANLISKVTKTEITLEDKGGFVYQVKADGQYKIMGMDPAFLKDISTMNTSPLVDLGTLDIADVKTGFRKVTSTVSEDLTRPNLCGIFLDGPTGKFVTADGVRLSVFKLKQPALDSIFFNSSVAKVIAGLAFSTATIHKADTYMKIELDSEIVVYSRLVDGLFPNYNMIIDKINKDAKIFVELDVETMGEALKRCAIFREQETMVFLYIQPTSVGIKVGKIGEGKEVVPAVSNVIEPMTIALNIDFLITCFDTLTKGPSRWKIIVPTAPIMIEQDDTIYSCILAPYTVEGIKA